MTATAFEQPNEQSPGDKAEVPAAAAAPEQPAGDDKGFMRSLFEAVGGALAKVGIGKDGKAQAAASKAADKAEDASHTFSEIAGIITTLAKDSLGDLLLHPGHATVGVYYLARRHQMEHEAERLDGSHVGDADRVASLARYTDISDCIYPDRYEELVVKGKLLAEDDIIFQNTDVHKLQPGFFIARDPPNKKILWVLRGTHDIHDILTDLCGIATPLPGGGFAHWGMWQSALWLMDHHLDRVIDALKAHPGYDLAIVGHSMGAGVAALIGRVIKSNAEVASKLGQAKVECICICPAAVMSQELATECGDYVTSLVMRYDLVPRFSTASVEELKEEVLQIDYKGLLSEDVMGNENVKAAIEATTRAAEKFRVNEAAQKAQELLQKAHETAGSLASRAAAHPAVQAAGEKAAGHANSLARTIDSALSHSSPSKGATSDAAAAAVSAGASEKAADSAAAAKGVAAKAAAAKDAVAGAALQSEPVRAALGWVSAALKAAASAGKPPAERHDTAAAAAAAVAAVDKAEKKDVGGVVAERRVSGSGHEREAAEEAQEAGELVDVRLYAPGRIFWLRPTNDEAPEDQHKFELVDTGCDARFQRIVLRASCLTDHFPASAKAALQDVLSRVKKPAAA